MESCMKDKDLKVVVMWDLEVLWVAFFITRVDGRSVCSWTNPTNAPGTRRDEGILGNVDQSHLGLVPLPVGVRGSPRRLQPRFHLLQELTWLSALQRLNNALPSHLSGGFRGGYIPFIRGCFPLTAQISKMQMHLEMPPHFPPSRRRWAVPMLCINKRFIRRVSVRRPAKFGTFIFHWGPEVWGVRGGGVGRIARGTLGAIPVMSWSNVRMETDGQRESGCRMLVSQDADETPSPYRGKPSTLKAPLAANQSRDHEHNTNTLLFPLMLASWLCCVCVFVMFTCGDGC